MNSWSIDLAEFGMRKRCGHDLRRLPDLLNVVTHGPRGNDIVHVLLLARLGRRRGS